MKDTEFVCELRATVNKIRLKLSLFTLGFHPFIEGQTLMLVPNISQSFKTTNKKLLGEIYVIQYKLFKDQISE